MSTPLEAPSTSFAEMLALAIDAGCLTYRDYIPWADAVIARLDRPPVWICNLSTIKYRPDALRVVRDFVFSEPFEPASAAPEDYLGFLWIRYERGEISWATFLSEAGRYSDASSVAIECEYFYSILNELEQSEFDSGLENRQREEVRGRLGEALARTRSFYDNIRKGG
jgi:hypothetical protein